MYRKFLIKEPDKLRDQAQIALVRSEGVWGVAIIDRALEMMGNAVGCQQAAEFRALHRRELRGWRRWYAEALCFRKT